MRKKKEMLNIKEAHVKEAVCPNGKSMRLRPNEAHTNEHNEETPAKKNQRRLHTGIVNRRQGRQRTPSPFPSTASKQLRKFNESPARLLNWPNCSRETHHRSLGFLPPWPRRYRNRRGGHVGVLLFCFVWLLLLMRWVAIDGLIDIV